MQTSPGAYQDIVFVCGALRSGTTLLHLMLDHHPRISNPGELDFFFECPRSSDGSPDIGAYREKLRRHPFFLKSGLSIDETLGYVDLVRSFADQLRQPEQALTINIHRHFDRIPEVFPEARYIHLLRDPRDVARSSIGMGWSGNAYHGVDHWIASESDFAALANALSADRIHRLKNEALILDPEAELSKICEFLGLSYDPAMLSYPDGSTYGAPDPRLVEQWRTKMSEAELSAIEWKLGDMLADRGYAASGAPIREPSAFEKMKLRWANRIGRLRFVAKRFGLFWTILEVLTRRAKLPFLRSAVRRHFNAVSEEYLK